MDKMAKTVDQPVTFMGEMTTKIIIRETRALETSNKGVTIGELIDIQLSEMRENGAEILSVTVNLPMED